MSLHIKKYSSPIIIGIIVLLFGIVISNYFGLYDQIAYLDNVYHYLGGVVLGWFFFRYLSGPEFKLTTLNFLLVSVSLVCFIGVIWEFAERLSSVYSPAYFPWLYDWFRGGALNDTLIDLVADMLGGLTFVGINLFVQKK